MYGQGTRASLEKMVQEVEESGESSGKIECLTE